MGDTFLDSIHIIDSATRDFILTVPVGVNPEFLAMPSNESVVSVDRSGTVAVFDLNDLTAFPNVFLISSPGIIKEIRLSPDGSELFVLQEISSDDGYTVEGIEVLVLDLVSGLELDRIEIAPELAGPVFATSFAVTPDAQTLIVLVTSRIIFVGLSGVCTEQPADANGNGVLEIEDVTILRRLLAGFPVP